MNEQKEDILTLGDVVVGYEGMAPAVFGEAMVLGGVGAVLGYSVAEPFLGATIGGALDATIGAGLGAETKEYQ